MEPICTEPKLSLVGFGDRVPGVTPLPDKPTLSVAVGELLRFHELPVRTLNVNDTLPLAVPVACGKYTTVTCVLLPDESVTGRVSPLKEKAALLTVA